MEKEALMSLKEKIQAECKVTPIPEKIDETIRIVRTAMKSTKAEKTHSYSYFLLLQIKQMMPAIWIIQTLIILAFTVFWLFIGAYHPVAYDTRFIALIIGFFSIYIAMLGVYLMVRSFQYNMEEIEMSTMISTRRLLFTRLIILVASDIVIFGIVIVMVKEMSQMSFLMILSCILAPFLLANCIGLTVKLYTSSDSYRTLIATPAIVLSFALFLIYSFVPSILNFYASYIGGTICVALFLLCANRIGKLSAKISTMDLTVEID